jgi:hypothetical protein
MQTGYIKSNMTKHIAPKLFFPHELQQSREINVVQTKSCYNLADLFNKSLPTSSFEKCVWGIGMRRLRELQDSRGVSLENYLRSHHIELFSLWVFSYKGFFPIRVFSYNVFNETMLTWAYVLSLGFPTGVFLEITKGHKILLKLLEIMVEYCFKSLFFPQGFGRCNSIDLKACIRSRGSVRNEKGVNSPVQTNRGPKTVPASWRTVKPHDHHGDVVVCLMSVLWIASRYSGYKLFLA